MFVITHNTQTKAQPITSSWAYFSQMFLPFEHNMWKLNLPFDVFPTHWCKKVFVLVNNMLSYMPSFGLNMASKAIAVFTFKGADIMWTFVALCVCECRQLFSFHRVALECEPHAVCVFVCLCVFVLAFHIYSLYVEHFMYVHLMYRCISIN